LQGFSKLFQNSETGWIANVFDGLLPLKIFDIDIAMPVAPGEGRIEIYAHNDG
jgi:hypothetical protein